MSIEDMVEDSFEGFMEEFKIDPEGSLNDMLFELFVAGFEAALDIMSEEDDDGETEEGVE